MLNKTTVRPVLISILFLFIFLQSKAQTEVDSLKALLPGLKGIERIHMLSTISDRLRAIDPDESLRINDQVLEEAARGGYQKELAVAMLVRASLFINLSKMDEAEALLIETREVALKANDYKVMANLELTLGNLYAKRGNHSLAIEAMLEGLKLVEAENDENLIPAFLMNIAYIHQKTGDLEKAEKSLNRAAQICERIGLVFRAGEVYINLGLLEYQRNNIGSSVEYTKKALAIFRKMENKAKMAISLQNLGFGYALMNKTEDALACYEESIALKEQIGDISGIGKVMQNKAKLWKAQKKYSRAIAEANQALAVATKTKDKLEKRNTYYLLYQINNEKGNIAEALNNFRKYSLVKDSVLKDSNKQRVDELVAKYESEKKDEALVMSQERLQMSDQEKTVLKSRQLVLVIAVVLLIALMYALFLTFRNYAARAKIKEKLLAEKTRSAELLKENLEKKLLIKENDLIDYLERIQQKNDLISDIESRLEQFEKDGNLTIQGENISEIALSVERKVIRSITWEEFRLKFDQVHKSFVADLLVKHTDLTNNELDICVLLKINLANKEIAQTLNMSYDSVKKSMQRLYKKLKFDSNEELRAYIIRL